MSVADLELQYDPRPAVPEHPEFIARWALDSAHVRGELTAELDVAYGEGAGETLDYFPATGPASPILIFIHGGIWQRLDKSDYSYLAPAFVEANVSFVSVNYPLVPNANFDQMTASVSAAVAWVIKNAAELNGDASQIVLAGHSAGAHLAAMAATRQDVAGLVAISGIYDLAPIALVPSYQNLALDEGQIERNSPVRLLPKTEHLPVVLAVGALESDAFKSQQAALAEKWQAVRSVELPRRHHYSSVDGLGDPDYGLFDLALLLLDGRLGTPAPSPEAVAEQPQPQE